MKKILLIGAEAPQVEALARRLEAGDTQIRAAPGGLYALTMLERERPHLILTCASLGDMTGIELCSMVKNDFALSDVQVILLARNLDEKVDAERRGEFDLILLDDRPLEALAGRLGRLIRRGLLDEEAPAPPGLGSGSQSLNGSLGVLSFAELTQALSQTSKTGRLSLEAENGLGAVWFCDGKIQHATFHNGSGPAAFARLFYETERTVNTAFRFEPMTLRQMQRHPKTIDQTAPQLLLAAAVDLDQNTTTEMVTAGIKEWLQKEEQG